MRPDNILLIRLSSIGDVLHCTPVARTLREHFPQARISWLVGEKSQEILHGNPDLDNIILWQREKWEQELRKGSWQKSVADFRMLTQQLKNERYDMVIDLQGLLLTGLIGWRSGARTRIGFRQAREGSALFYTHRVRNEHRLQIVQHYLQLLRPLGIRRFNTQMVMPLAQRHYDFASNLFSSQNINEDQDRVIILNPSTSWPTKCWPPAYYARLANLLGTGLAAKIMLLGAPGDVPLLKEISAGISQPVINLAGKTNLKELAAVVQKSHLFISGDTGIKTAGGRCISPPQWARPPFPCLGRRIPKSMRRWTKNTRRSYPTPGAGTVISAAALIAHAWAKYCRKMFIWRPGR